jgi:tRNA dimethylallyltransferase
VIALLNGEIDETQARERTAQATRRFARRQDSWFRKDQRISWLQYDDPDLVEKAIQVLRKTVLAQGNRRGTGGVVGVETNARG